ncbi:MAG: 16S rRNA (uracil(1498)-N(3))-methyltransferase [Alphaproteobacteria bacterium]
MNNINRLYIEEDLAANSSVVLNKEQSHYLINVLRQKVGNNIKLFNGRNGEWLGEIRECHKNSVTIHLIQLIKEQGAEINIELIFSPIRNSRLPYLIEKATELGATKLTPIITQNTVSRNFNVLRAKSIAIEAAEQSERLTVPIINEIISFSDLIKDWDSNNKIFFCDERKIKDLELKSDFQIPVKNAPIKHTVLIGPEGGFNENERSILTSLPYVIPVTLGPRILRTETAAVVALAYLNFNLSS